MARAIALRSDFSDAQLLALARQSKDASQWPAAGLGDTEIRLSNRIEGLHAATSIQPRVQA
jgi:hypothetical protein